MAGTCNSNGEKRNAYRLLVGKPEGKRPLGWPRHRWVWIILGWILERWDGVMWTGLVWLRIGTGGEVFRYWTLLAKLVPTFSDRGVPRGQRDGSLLPYSRFSRQEPLLFLSSSSSVVLTRLCGPRSRLTTSKETWQRRKSNLGPLDL
jgi:hypothetical protein